nr:MAG TPA: hypothetical protein [Caudoviricetes sp.]
MFFIKLSARALALKYSYISSQEFRRKKTRGPKITRVRS